MWRDVFQYSLSPEVFMDEVNIRNLLVTAGITGNPQSSDINSDAFLEALELQLETQKKSLRSKWSSLLGIEDSDHIADEIIIEQSAPMAASLGVWLQGMSAPGVFEDEVNLKILSLLADDVGAGFSNNGRKDKFSLIGRVLGAPNYTTDATQLVSDTVIDDDAFCLPAMLFALSRRSDAFALELAGIDFAFRSIGLLPSWHLLMEHHPQLGWDAIDLSQSQTNNIVGDDSPLSLSRWIVEQYSLNKQNIKRIHDGVAWAIAGLNHWNNTIFKQVTIATNPELSMARLLKTKARQASVYHQKYLLEGKLLSIWFEEAKKDPFPLLEAIGKSKLVRPLDPENSPLISTLLKVNRSMFRIFSEKDITTIYRWISSLDSTQPGAVSKQRHLFDKDLPIRLPVASGDFTLGQVPSNLRDAYHLLQGRALAPQTREFAIDYVEGWLRYSYKSIDKTSRSMPSTYIRGQLREWLLNSHDKNAKQAKQQLNSDVPSREDVIDQTLQLAPLTLIDGAWLQGFTDINLSTKRFGSPLFQIYWDELGNGDKSINHPKIYRDVLKAMDVTLPPTGDHAFAHDLRLREESFRLPVYWLCIGKLPATYCLEILGMNLAMELSGVGGGYVTAHRFLEHYKFPTIFVKLHNTIDNVSSGHSAWAADAIEEYMEYISPHADINHAWNRVRAGYESLAPIVKSDSDLNYFKKNKKLKIPKDNFDFHHHQSSSHVNITQGQHNG